MQKNPWRDIQMIDCNEGVQVTILAGGKYVRLEEDFGVIDSLGIKVLVPSGFLSDGASIPRWAWSFIGGPFSGKYREAALIHDYECVEKMYLQKDTHRRFYEVMRFYGVGWFKAQAMHKAVVIHNKIRNSGWK